MSFRTFTLVETKTPNFIRYQTWFTIQVVFIPWRALEILAACNLVDIISIFKKLHIIWLNWIAFLTQKRELFGQDTQCKTGLENMCYHNSHTDSFSKLRFKVMCITFETWARMFPSIQHLYVFYKHISMVTSLTCGNTII